MALRDWFWLIFLGAIWGGSFLFNAILIGELSPLWVSAARVLIGALGCWVVFLVLRKSLPRDPWLYVQFMILGVLSYTIPFALFPLSQQHLASGVAAIINALTPITTVIVSQLWPGGERATWFKVLGIIAGFAGVAILALPALQEGGASQLWAIGACLLATVCYAIALNYARTLAKVEATTTATLSLTAGGLVGLVAALSIDGVPVVTQAQTWWAALGIGLISTTLAYQVMYRILPRVGATNFATVTFIAPISAIILGIWLLGETILPIHIAGMAVIFIGLLCLDGRVLRRLTRRAA